MRHYHHGTITRSLPLACLAIALLLSAAGPASSEGKADKSFHAVTVDAKGIEMDMRHVVFYWEEKISETSFVPHEFKEVPVRRGTATVKIKFDNIEQIDVASSGNGALPTVTITLSDGKRGEFPLALPGSFKGRSDFGEVQLPVSEMKRLTFK